MGAILAQESDGAFDFVMRHLKHAQISMQFNYKHYREKRSVGTYVYRRTKCRFKLSAIFCMLVEIFKYSLS